MSALLEADSMASLVSAQLSSYAVATRQQRGVSAARRGRACRGGAAADATEFPKQVFRCCRRLSEPSALEGSKRCARERRVGARTVHVSGRAKCRRVHCCTLRAPERYSDAADPSASSLGSCGRWLIAFVAAYELLSGRMC